MRVIQHRAAAQQHQQGLQTAFCQAATEQNTPQICCYVVQPYRCKKHPKETVAVITNYRVASISAARKGVVGVHEYFLQPPLEL